MRKGDIPYLKHILDAISRIEEYVRGITYDSFMENHLVQDGVIRQIEIIGEAAKRLSRQIREKHPYIAWKDMTGMRDKLIHDYLGVDLDAVWETVERDIPLLEDQLREVMEREK